MTGERESSSNCLKGEISATATTGEESQYCHYLGRFSFTALLNKLKVDVDIDL